MADYDNETVAGPWASWRTRLEASRKRRDERIASWQSNVQRRTGTDDTTTDSYDRIHVSRENPGVSVNQDWSLTKAKIAQLYSQTPQVRLTPRRAQLAPAVPNFGRRVNDAVHDAAVGSVIEENLADTVNASGIGAALVFHEVRTELRDMPVVDPSLLPPEMQQAMALGAVQIPTQPVEVTVDTRFCVSRISPADLLVPADFTGSDYDQCRWLGHDGRLTWVQAQAHFGLTDEQKDDVLGSDKRAAGQSALHLDQQKFRDADVVNYTEVFYWRYCYHADETSFSAVQRVVLVDGVDEPVINEEYRGQERLEDGRLVGVLKLPIRVLTLTYISDDCLPPSDSTIGRFQVRELEASRDAMVQQRKHSIPIRWFDANRVSPNTRSLLEKGDFQGFIPVNGTGDRAVGEVARASFPSEKFEFDRVIKSDLTEIWQVGTNQAGAFASGERSASEARIIQQNFATRVGQERDKVTRYFIGIAECLAGLIALYGEVELPDELQAEGPGGTVPPIAKAALANEFTYSVRVDSTVLLDAEQQMDKLLRLWNLFAQSGVVDQQAMVKEAFELSGYDPSKFIVDPKPKPTEPVNISINSAEEAMNPLMYALLMKTGQAPSPQDLAAAIEAIQAALSGIVPGMGGGPPPSGPLPPDQIDRPQFDAAPRVERRGEDFGA